MVEFRSLKIEKKVTSQPTDGPTYRVTRQKLPLWKERKLLKKEPDLKQTSIEVMRDAWVLLKAMAKTMKVI